MKTYRVTLVSDDWFPSSDWLPLLVQIDNLLDIGNNPEHYDLVTDQLEQFFTSHFSYDFEVNSPDIDFEYCGDVHPDLIVTPSGVRLPYWSPGQPNHAISQFP